MPREREDEEEKVEADIHETGDEPEEKELSTEPEEKDEEDSSDPNDERPSRQERRSNRYKEAKELAAQAQQRADEANRQLVEERARVAALQETSRVIQYQATLQAQGQQRDPWDEHFAELERRGKAIAAEVASLRERGAYDQANAERLQGEWMKLGRQQQEAVVQRENQRRDWAAQQQAPQIAAQQEERARQAAYSARLQQEFPEVSNHPQAFQWGFFEFQKRVLTEGKPNTWETAQQVMNEAAQRFKLRPPPRPDENARRRYAGVSGGGGGGSERGGTIKMTKQLMEMAEARFKKLAKEKGPAAAHKKWAETIGKRVMEEAD